LRAGKGGAVLGYELSASDDIRAVFGAWDAFAAATVSPGAMAERVQGRPLWDFVQGEPTRIWLERLFHDVRRSGDPAQLTCRCDGGGVERAFLMQVEPAPCGGVRVRHRLLRARPLRVLPLPPLPGVVVCSICGAASADRRFWHAPGRWQAASAAPAARYVICPDCAGRFG
jgi:hypothetical protein